MERFFKGCIEKNPSVAAPSEYARRFVRAMKRMYQCD